METLLNPFIVFSIVTTLVVLAVGGFKLSERVEAWREECYKRAQKVRDEGLPLLAELLERTAFRDKTGQIAAVVRIVKTYADPEERQKEVDHFLRTQLEKACKDGDRLKGLAKIVAQYAPAVSAINAVVAAAVPVTAPITAPVAVAAKAAGAVAAVASA